MNKIFNVTFSYCVDIVADDEDEAYEKAIEKYITIDPRVKEMNYDIEEVDEKVYFRR